MLKSVLTELKLKKYVYILNLYVSFTVVKNPAIGFFKQITFILQNILLCGLLHYLTEIIDAIEVVLK